MRPFDSPEVAAKFAAHPPTVRRKLLALRELVFRTAQTTEGAGEIDELLPRGQPASITRNKIGGTVRMDWKKADSSRCALMFALADEAP